MYCRTSTGFCISTILHETSGIRVTGFERLVKPPLIPPYKDQASLRVIIRIMVQTIGYGCMQPR